ncbi:hypothetical protein LTR70_008793 [Exophiala xenobiotica]|uniref:Oxidoreductase acuF-like C2H2 type zinc-finger domain-containing protein n=1 Tax=Lithohypha guttulata TaxID=1690604 RepID=A0ABR0K0S8_9EURO|nr:hypothetical protein LTR24_008672 [Lithohypha guttulata]KAK5311432.1 hypothetical protein LTR70_008793 [Exophiala xenobiotica]
MNCPRDDLAKLVKACFGAFGQLRSLKQRNADTQTSVFNAIVAFNAWEDEAGRLRIWSGNLGAHQTGSSSLSYRLRHAPSIKQEVIETLEVVLGALNEAVDLFNENIVSGSISDEGYVVELYKDVVDSTKGLFRLSTAIRNPSRRDQILERTDIDRSMEPLDQSHVRDKLPKASNLLVERLGRANTQRRANLRYLQRHHEKLAQGLLDEDDDYKSKLSGTVATNLETHLITGQDDDSVSVAASATSYAPSLFDSTKRFPSKPKPTTLDGRFECPLCFYIIKTDSIAAWRKHVFVDLQPYVCLLADCSYANKLFINRREWFTHEKQQHFNRGQSLSHCPLCLEALSSLTAEKHLGRHLEDLALFTLPSVLFDDEEEEEEVGSNLEKEESTGEEWWSDYLERMEQQQDTEQLPPSILPPNVSPTRRPYPETPSPLSGYYSGVFDKPSQAYGLPGQYPQMPTPRSGHTFGKTAIKGNAKVHQGNILDSTRPSVNEKKQTCGDAKAENETNKFDGDVTTEFAKEFYLRAREASQPRMTEQ